MMDPTTIRLINGEGNLVAAALTYRRLAANENRLIRAAALMRLARVIVQIRSQQIILRI